MGVASVSEPEVLDALDGKVVWARDYVETRYRWKSRDPLALAVRREVEPLDAGAPF